MEDHKGALAIGAPEWLSSVKEWRDMGGATFVLVMPADKAGSIVSLRAANG
jgi:hypothetical protein